MRKFTLIELLVVIGIMALVAAISAVAFGPMIKGGRIASGSRCLQAALYSARSEAAFGGQKTCLLIWRDKGRMAVYSTPQGVIKWHSSASGDGTISDSELEELYEMRISEPHYLPNGVDFADDMTSAYIIRMDGADQMFYLVGFEPSGGLDQSLHGDGNLPIGLRSGDFNHVVEVRMTTGLTITYDWKEPK